MDDDYDSADDAIAVPAPLSRRKRKLAKREAEAPPAKKQRQSQSPPPNVNVKPARSDGGSKNATSSNKNGTKDATGTKRGGVVTRANSGHAPPRAAAAASIDESIAGMDRSMMADFVAQRVQRANKDLSFVELGDRVLPESVYIDTSAHPARSLSSLCDYMEKFCTKKGQSSISHLKSSPKAPGSPHTLVIAPAALRAADLVRTLRKYQTPDAAVAKFFAKHVKLSEAAAYATKTRIGIAVGTPARIVDLIRDGSLQMRYLARVVLDVSYLDAKQRGMWDIKEVQDRVVELLNMEVVRKRLEGGSSEEDSRGVMFF
ncbi:hypothetical protein TWF696_005374 [Orbilia brochopaga]|uniref:Uncharacterized protein n=1 Tax=Orbilia brochopaga TaxID=3140254 RepID=A0AAV9V2A4_9PEZI